MRVKIHSNERERKRKKCESQIEKSHLIEPVGLNSRELAQKFSALQTQPRLKPAARSFDDYTPSRRRNMGDEGRQPSCLRSPRRNEASRGCGERDPGCEASSPSGLPQNTTPLLPFWKRVGDSFNLVVQFRESDGNAHTPACPRSRGVYTRGMLAGASNAHSIFQQVAAACSVPQRNSALD